MRTRGRSLLADGDLAGTAVSLAAHALGDLLDLATALQEGSDLRLDGLAGFHGRGGFADSVGRRLDAKGGHDLDLFQIGGRSLCLKPPVPAWIITLSAAMAVRTRGSSRRFMACIPDTYAAR